MTNICTKVTVRKRPIKNGQVSLYLDFYPAIRHPKTGKPTRREYLGIYIYADPKDKFEAEFNKTMLRNAELVKCRRTEAIINEEYGFLDRNRGKESFLEYFRSKMADDDNYRNWNTAYKHFEKYCGGSCTFDNLTLDFCQGFLTYLLSLTTPTKGKMMASTANNNLNKLKCVLRIAYEEKRIKENIAPRLKHAKESSTKREFLTLEEVRMLAATPCEKPVIRSAALFSCLTGLRISDIIRLQWENIIRGADGGWCMHIVTKKTKTEAVLPLSDEALALCGERGEGQVFKPSSLSQGLDQVCRNHQAHHVPRVQAHIRDPSACRGNRPLYHFKDAHAQQCRHDTGLCRCGERPQAQGIRTDYTQMKTDTYII